MSTSLSIPQIPKAIPRPRLLARLQNANGQRLILISAPPGYGKTTLAAQFAQATDLPLAWHTIQRHHHDILSFQDDLFKALYAVTDCVPPNLPPQVTTAEMAELAAAYLEEAFNGAFALFLDDAHHLRGEAETWLQELIDHLPPSGRIILSSRTVPPLSFAELLVRGQVLALGTRDLQLTVEEAADLAALVQAPNSPAEIEALVNRMEGWPAGIVLALRPMPEEFARQLPGAGSGEALFNLLAANMITLLPVALREFLLYSSTLNSLTPDACAALNLTNPAQQLEEIRAQNLFVSETAQGLTYHALFQEFLQNSLRTSDPQRYCDLHARAGTWMESQDRVDLAFDHYLSAGQYPRAVSLADKLAPAYYGQGRFETLLDWEGRLARSGTIAPRLTYECAVVQAERYNYSEAELLLERASRSATDQDDELWRGQVQRLKAYILLRRGHYREAIDLALPLTHSQNEALRGRALRVVGLARLRLGQVSESIEILKQAEALLRASGLVSALSHLLQDLQLAYTRAGQLEEAGHCLQEVVALRRKLGGASGLALALNNLGYNFHQQSSYSNAILTLEEGLRELERSSDQRTEAYLNWSLGDVLRDLAHWDDAEKCYEQALAALDPSSDPNLIASVLTAMSVLKRRRHAYAEAVRLAEEALFAAGDVAFERVLAQAALWAARAYMGEAGLALQEIKALIVNLQQQQAHFEVTGLTAMCAAIHLSQSEETEALKHLEDAMELGQSLGTAQLVAVEILASPALTQLAESQQLASRTAEALTRLRQARREISPRVRPLRQTDEATYSLRVLTLGQELVERNGVAVQASAWQAAAARAVFYYLLLGPRTREEIGLQFWPDAHDWQIFYTTMHRARTAVGRQVILFQDNLYRINPDVEVWCDALELEKTARQARLLSYREARAEHLWQRAARLYQGEFLAAYDGDWVNPRRELYRDIHYESLLGLGHCAAARGDQAEALEHYRRAVEAEPYHEAAYQAIIGVYIGLGQKQKALAYFERLRRILHDELGVSPSSDTELLIRSLLL